MHSQSEGHVRQMLLIGEDPKKYINDYSSQFQRDFLQLLRTSHGEKQVHINRFYQEYIADKNHIHMNATKWPSLTLFAQWLGREGICRVEETEEGVHIAWIDNSPEALRRQDAIRKKERQDKGDEEREQTLIREQVRKAKQDAEKRGLIEADEAERELKRDEGEKIKLSFGGKHAAQNIDTPISQSESAEAQIKSSENVVSEAIPEAGATSEPTEEKALVTENAPAVIAPAEMAPPKVALKMGVQSKPKNVFAVAKKNALGGKKGVGIEQPKKMSEAERIMKEEIERKRAREVSGSGGPHNKRQRF